MKTRWIIVALFASVLIALVFVSWKLKKVKNELQLTRLELAVQNDTIESFRTRDSTLVSRLQSVEVDKSVLKEALEELGFTTKQLREEKIKWQSIATVLKAKLESSGQGQAVIHDTLYIHKTDTIRAGKFNWTNKYLTLDGTIKEKQLSFNYIYNTDISVIQTKNKNGTQISLILSDKNAKIMSGSSFTVSHKKSFMEKWWVTIPIGVVGGILITK